MTFYHLRTSTSPDALIDHLVKHIGTLPDLLFNPPMIIAQNAMLKKNIQHRIARHYGVHAFLTILTQSQAMNELKQRSLLSFAGNGSPTAHRREFLAMNIFSILFRQWKQNAFTIPPLKVLIPFLHTQSEISLCTSIMNIAYSLASVFILYAQNNWQIFWKWTNAQMPSSGQMEKFNNTVYDHLEKFIFENMELPPSYASFNSFCQLKNVPDINKFEIFIIGSAFLTAPLQDILLHLSESQAIHHYLFTPSHEFWFDSSSASFTLYEHLKPLGAKALRYIYDQVDPVEEILLAENLPPLTTLGHIRQCFINDSLPSEKVPLSPDDHSLHFHACPASRREVEVCLNEVFALLEQESCDAEDILITSPDLTEYMPFITSLFGSSEIMTEQGPFTFSFPLNLQAPVKYQHTLLYELISMLLKFSESDDYFNDLHELLKHPWVQSRLSLDSKTFLLLVNYLQQHISVQGKPSAFNSSEYFITWLTQLKNDFCFELCTNTPSASFKSSIRSFPIQSSLPEFQEVLIGFFDFIHYLAGYLESVKGHSKPFQDWCSFFISLVQNISKAPSVTDETLTNQFTHILSEAGQLHKTTVYADDNLDFNWFRQWIRHLQFEVTTVQPHKGIHVLPLTQARFVPFKHIFVLGMNDESFPRKETPSPLNLLPCSASPLYTTLKEVDQYHFLELLYQASHSLHFFYISTNPSNHETVPIPTTLLELQSLCEDIFTWDHRVSSLPLIIHHPLESFGAAFPIRQMSFSFLARDHQLVSICRSTMISETKTENQLTPANTVSVASLTSFLNNPSRFYLNQKYGYYTPQLSPIMVDYKNYFDLSLDRLQDILSLDLYSSTPAPDCDTDQFLESSELLDIYPPLRQQYEEVMTHYAEFKTSLSIGSIRPVYFLGKTTAFNPLFHRPKQSDYFNFPPLRLFPSHHPLDITGHIPSGFSEGGIVFCRSDRPSESHFFKGLIHYLILLLHPDVPKPPPVWNIHVFSLKSGSHSSRSISLCQESALHFLTILTQSCLGGMAVCSPFHFDIAHIMFQHEKKHSSVLSEEIELLWQKSFRDAIERKYTYSPELEIIWGTPFHVPSFFNNPLYQQFYKPLRNILNES